MQDEKDVLIVKLGEALQEAIDHLDYCNYGDWERECAEASDLEGTLTKAINLFNKFNEVL